MCLSHYKGAIIVDSPPTFILSDETGSVTGVFYLAIVDKCQHPVLKFQHLLLWPWSCSFLTCVAGRTRWLGLYWKMKGILFLMYSCKFVKHFKFNQVYRKRNTDICKTKSMPIDPPWNMFSHYLLGILGVDIFINKHGWMVKVLKKFDTGK